MNSNDKKEIINAGADNMYKLAGNVIMMANLGFIPTRIKKPYIFSMNTYLVTGLAGYSKSLKKLAEIYSQGSITDKDSIKAEKIKAASKLILEGAEPMNAISEVGFKASDIDPDEEDVSYSDLQDSYIKTYNYLFPPIDQEESAL
ncbi:hypothetical protein bplSymb_SCF12001P001 [Bathymodiolus platifrons methanotrophic gill symbiont]|uniref:hypothetical protein n=1 Tax=Bathymodiolus platifrons methanotrophic gill symbiont TaxID=113268 RepID=UPI000B7023CC|nr:hypothetical protein [Bathymodiolus platifrons methanotrophic gill symbiont]TXK93501.1 hypothetical protein BMR02_15120 [Methylococcaceae bacterium HT1]TXL03225.1 hypothetical protein BMR08_17345 [Methylococcaceae bacterium CS2]TXL04198.1 hypothetical protein BMR07_13095 [Methylococcaceae bacterium CS1]TXL12762.1 hypothetical protein BMR04_15025 [Methylococcaceae bacterium HT3]TXL15387.1 hypothetical protein BMR06_16110 [Methylococcaceae bacterium HT5]TXL19653.1 hypothetical protein BMR03_